jgi:adenylate kinase
MTRLVLLGPPGAGKGTQASRLCQHLGVPTISTGDIFRRNVAEGTDLGREARRYMDAGEYVPDSVTNAMVADRLAEPDAERGFLLDGYPRTTAQVQELDRMLAAAATQLDVVVELTADVEEVVGRLLRRAEIEGRSDDTEDVVRRRLEVYAEQTAPLTELYSRRGLLVRVDGMGDIDDVTGRLVEALSSRRGADRIA